VSPPRSKPSGPDAATSAQPRRRLRLGGWLALVLAIGTLAMAARLFLQTHSGPTARISLVAGYAGTTRVLLARTLLSEIQARGVHAELVEGGSTAADLARVHSGEVDLAMISAAFRTPRFADVREVAPLYVEALHLVVKEELADSVEQGLAGLHGRTVFIGPPGSATAGLSTSILDFAALMPGAPAARDAIVPLSLEPDALFALIARGDRSALPDAIFHLGTVPSKVVQQLVHGSGYRLVPIPFAEAFRLAATISETRAAGAAVDVEPQYTMDTTIPAFTYGTEPPVPAEPLHTLGSRLLLVANKDLSQETVAVLLDAIFASQFARIPYPPLDTSVFALPPRLEWHPGTVAYLGRDKPLLTADSFDRFNDLFKRAAGLAGAVLFLRQWWRQRTQAKREDAYTAYMLRVATIERQVAVLELSATLELEPLAVLQREILQLKGDALDRFAAGELGNEATLTDLLGPVNAARDHIANLLLHVRDNLEDAAQSQGRTAQALWEEAAGDESGAVTVRESSQAVGTGG